jgi:MinD superfamily P-loop ATPase
MKEVVVLSGKGGTGKTSIVGSFAALADNAVFTDCDVDASDLHLLLQPTAKEDHEFWSGQTANIDTQKCTECGLCENLCRFKAIRDLKVEQVSCEGCGFCFNVCPGGAITMKENLAGQWFISNTKYGLLVHARLGIAQENSGKLVALVRQQAKQLAEEKGLNYIISDGPPGIGCPVISSISGANLALLVTEPTRSGIHDLDRVLSVCQHFNVPAMVCINKFDINLSLSSEIEDYCKSRGVQVAARIPFDNIVTEAMVHGLPIVNYKDTQIGKQVRLLWQEVFSFLKNN